MTTKTMDDFEVSFKTHLGPASEDVVDDWELEASRRALQNLKALLHDQPMLDLLDTQLREADEKIKGYLAASNGEFRECRVEGSVKGIGSQAFFGWMIGKMMAARPGMGTPEEKAKACLVGYSHHPEHYVVPPRYMGIVETMGGMPTRCRVVPQLLDTAPQFVKDSRDLSYTQDLFGQGELDDGTVYNYAYHQFKDSPEGCDLILRIWFPVAAPEIYWTMHAQHFAIEFRNGIRQAAEEILGT